MTRDVVTVLPTATFHEMTGLMNEKGISALPVVDHQGVLLGIVSEADLLLKESPPRARRHRLREGRRQAELRRKAEAVDAAGALTTPVVSIGSGASMAAAVRLLQARGIKRLVVMGVDNRLVGIVSRHDLLAGFSRSDDEIRTDIVDGVIPRWLLVDPVHVHVEVRGGVVRLDGTVERRSDAELLPHLVRGLDGVVDVDSTLEFSFDDRNLSPSREQHVS
ncbi:MAG: CBS domain-containing protein [Candidatus Dormibacteraeota bacterium]|nr:CBS domain-containing protein [Candidatus Dormibacteraeota bacterium]